MLWSFFPNLNILLCILFCSAELLAWPIPLYHYGRLTLFFKNGTKIYHLNVCYIYLFLSAKAHYLDVTTDVFHSMTWAVKLSKQSNWRNRREPLEKHKMRFLYPFLSILLDFWVTLIGIPPLMQKTRKQVVSTFKEIQNRKKSLLVECCSRVLCFWNPLFLNSIDNLHIVYGWFQGNLAC